MDEKNETGTLITSKQIKSYINNISNNLKSDINKLLSYKRQIRENEKKYVNTLITCPLKKTNYFRDKLSNLDTFRLKEIISNNFYDPEVMRSMLCLTDAIVYLQPFVIGNISTNERIRYWLTSLTQIGKESVEGYAITSNINPRINNSKDNKLFVIKAPRSSANEDDLLHELFIAYQLNSLRKYVPNFAYAYGGFKCSPPIIDQNEDVVAWCNNTKKTIQYIAYENIQPSLSMGDFVKTCTFTDFLNKYLQILYSLSVAHKKLDFTHYDLHHDNVLLRKLPQLTYIPYDTETGRMYLKTDSIATIIDFGFSHIQVNVTTSSSGRGGEMLHYGIWDFIPYGVYPRASFPMHDAYKFLLMSMRVMYENKNMECFNKASQILTFFNSDETPIQILKEQYDTFYSLILTDVTKNIYHYDLTTYIRNKFPNEVSKILYNIPPSNSRILGCTGTDICYTSDEIVDILGINEPLKINNIFEFYDLITRLKKENKNKDAQHIINKFPYKKLYPDTIRKIRNILSKIKTKLSTFTYQSIKNVDNFVFIFDRIFLIFLIVSG
jgi:hypothetical protein